MQEYTRETAIALLQAKAHALAESGQNRYPRRADFSEREVIAIKAFLGAWPRALEKAGVKPMHEGSADERFQISEKRNDP